MTASVVDVDFAHRALAEAEPLAEADETRPAGDARSLVARIFVVLGAFESDDMSMSLSELSQRTGLAKGTLHRICKQLLDQGAVERTKYGYRLGFRMAELGTRVVTTSRLRQMTMPYLQELNRATDCAAHLGILLGDDVFYLESVCSHQSSSVSARPGARALAHTTALGIAMLAALGEHARLEYARRHGVSQAWLDAEADATQRKGIATLWRGGHAKALGGAIVAHDGEPICGLSVVVPPGGVLRKECGPALERALAVLSRRLLAFGALGQSRLRVGHVQCARGGRYPSRLNSYSSRPCRHGGMCPLCDARTGADEMALARDRGSRCLSRGNPEELR